MPSFLDQLAAEGDRTISRGKQVVKQAINEAKNVAYNAVKSAKEMGKETIKQLDAGCQHLASAIRNGVEKGWIKSISFLKSSGELIINGAKYAVNVAVGAGRYTLQLGEQGITYVGKQGKIRSEKAVKGMQQAREAVSTNAIAFVKWSGQSLVEFKQNAQALIEQGVIQGLQLLDDGAKWVVNGAEYSAKLLIGAGVYTLKLGAKGLVYLVEGGKEIAITIVRNVQEVYKNGVALARLAGQNAKTFVANAEIAIKDGAIKTIQMAADGVNFMIDGQKYMTKVLIGGAVYALKMTKEGVKYATENGKMLALSAVNGLQNLYKNGVERAKAAGQDVRVFTAQVREAIKSGAIKSIQLAKDGAKFYVDGKEYAAKIAVGALVYGFRATKNGIKYVAENGKVLVEQAVKGLQNAYVGAVNLVEQTGQDLAEFQKNVQILVARGVIKSFELQKNATGALINGTAYGAKVALGAVSYSLKLTAAGIVYVSKQGKEIAAKTLLAIQQGGKDIITYGRKKGQDMAEYAQYLQQQVNNGVIKSFEFTKDTGKLLIDNIETYIDDSYKTFLKATNQKMENDLLWAYN